MFQLFSIFLPEAFCCFTLSFDSDELTWYFARGIHTLKVPTQALELIHWHDCNLFSICPTKQ